MTETVSVQGVSRPYNIHIGRHILDSLPLLMRDVTNAETAVVITDDNVDRFRGNTVCDILENSGFRVLKFVFQNGESNKSLDTVESILEFMAENRVTRSDCIVALGGGITGDISGFCAAVYLRGIDFIQVPTTFLAAIDSSVGGKTGVNLKSGKNLTGAFYQPRMVFCDTEAFDTLPEENFREGIAEAIKYGVICDRELFLRFKSKISDVEGIIKRCVTIKSEIVSRDEFDTGERQLLNFGHTIGHAIEKCTDFRISHGTAVGIGMVMMAKAAYSLGWSEENCEEKILAALKSNGLLCSCECSADELLFAMSRDKKRAGESITLVVPVKIGECVLKKMPISSLEDVIRRSV